MTPSVSPCPLSHAFCTVPERRCVISGDRSGFLQLKNPALLTDWSSPGSLWQISGELRGPPLMCAQKGLVSVNCRPAGVTGNGLLGMGGETVGRGRLDHALLQALPLLRTVYTGWRLNSLTISLEICYCSLLKGTDRRHFGRWMAPPQGITMKDSASGALPPLPESFLSILVPGSLVIHSLTPRHLKTSSPSSLAMCHPQEAGNWLRGFPVMKLLICQSLFN